MSDVQLFTNLAQESLLFGQRPLRVKRIDSWRGLRGKDLYVFVIDGGRK